MRRRARATLLACSIALIALGAADGPVATAEEHDTATTSSTLLPTTTTTVGTTTTTAPATTTTVAETTTTTAPTTTVAPPTSFIESTTSTTEPAPTTTRFTLPGNPLDPASSDTTLPPLRDEDTIGAPTWAMVPFSIGLIGTAAIAGTTYARRRNDD